MNELLRKDIKQFKENGGIGNLLVGLSLIFFYFVCILLPIVGQAAAHPTVTHFGKNRLSFLLVAVIGLALALLGYRYKKQFRENNPLIETKPEAPVQEDEQGNPVLAEESLEIHAKPSGNTMRPFPALSLGLVVVYVLIILLELSGLIRI